MTDDRIVSDGIQPQIDSLEAELRDLVEQAAAYSGAEDEDRMADRITDLEASLATLKRRRDSEAS